MLLSSKKEAYFFTKEGCNITKLKLKPYLFFTGIYLSIILGITYGCSFFVSFNLLEIFMPKNSFISAITWLITMFTLRAYLNGMEGNIMGFIYFPLLVLSILILFILSFSDILSSHNFISFNFPVLKLNFWLRLLLHCFMPFYILIYLNSNKDIKKQDVAIPILSILILQILFFAVNWILVSLFGNTLNISQFFGEEQTVIYYLPIISGFLYFFLFFISKRIPVKKRKSNKLETFSYYSMLLVFGGILLEIINYINLIIPFFE